MQTEIIDLTKLATPRRRAFGEFLVEQHVLDRFQLFRALQMQDRMPNTRLGHCAVALGYAPRAAIEQLHVRFTAAGGVEADFDSSTTTAFEREPEIEISPP